MDIIRLSDQIIDEGFRERAEDIYLLPYEEGFQLFFRCGQFRILKRSFSLLEGQQLITRFKYLGQMDIGEKRKPQAGSFTYSLDKQKIRLRLSSVGDYLQRESLVIRLLYGISESELRYFCTESFSLLAEKAAARGLYLFSGPVGSGKTTLMYRLAQEQKLQVLTVEDPVEIEVPEFLQLQVNWKIGQDYEQLLKLALRHRPDLLIIGEIRDEKTASAAVRAALTGHRVFATVHARDLSGTFTRINELTSRRSELTECLRGIVYQELLPNDQQQPALLWSYRFFENQGLVERTWETAYKEAKKGDWKTTCLKKR
ncbi:ComG operon protein 1 family protein [Enterococcus faecalis 13-SD-W-01]|nr:ComG operon protein 1 family protein [Enterococcus faecalis 13-SD-W-01]